LCSKVGRRIYSTAVQLCCYLSRVCADVVTGIVSKCLNARVKTKEAAISVCLMYIEIEKQDIVQVKLHTVHMCLLSCLLTYAQEEIMKGFTNKQPKIVAASIDVMKRALRCVCVCVC